MSNIRTGVLRAVRLLPDAVKIGAAEDKTDFPTDHVAEQEENQISNEDLSEDMSSFSGSQVQFKTLEKKREENQKSYPSKNTENNAKQPTEKGPDPLLELKKQITDLRDSLSAAETAKADLTGKLASTERELGSVREACAQKEREVEAGAEAAKEQARTAGHEIGHSEGLESGYKDGIDKAKTEISEQYREKFSDLVKSFEGIASNLESKFTELVTLNSPRMLRLWQDMLEKMLQRELNVTPDAVLDVLSSVLSRLSDKNRILIYVAPEDLEILQDSLKGEFEDVLRGVKRLDVKPDASVDKGSCIVETDLGIYDARWRTQLDQIDGVFEKLLVQLGKPPKLKTEVHARPKKPIDADIEDISEDISTENTPEDVLEDDYVPEAEEDSGDSEASVAVTPQPKKFVPNKKAPAAKTLVSKKKSGTK
ncbi:flagellar assembly protein FliH [Synergistales bacterium]|nr:flagellar assembly protein FliH [Synergistales bacterium]